MTKRLIPLLVVLLGLSTGCAMFTAWKSIPPPGGCDQCHTVAISSNWQVTYQAAILSDEKNRPYFQTDQYTMPRGSKPSSSLEIRKDEDQACFECHRSPNIKHMGRKGRYHH
jgi:hypothetical protein